MYYQEMDLNQMYSNEIQNILGEGECGMKTVNGFTLMEGSKEIKSFLSSKKVTRTVNKIQIHHMATPSYSTWEKTDKRLWPSDPHLGRTNSLNDYGKTTWGSKDASGKYIAQHFNVFPDGKITSGRDLNSTPIGISGWNTGAICIEIYGNFDKGQDTMTDAQRKAVIELTGELCVKFNLSPSENNLRYHGWFSSNGTYLGTYKAGSSRKTCPGTNFFGGNTMEAYKANFLPVIKDYILKGCVVDAATNFLVRVTASSLNVRSLPNSSAVINTTVKKGEVYTITKTSGSWGYLKSGAGWIHLNYTERV